MKMLKSFKSFILIGTIVIVLIETSCKSGNEKKTNRWDGWIDLTHTLDSQALCWPLDSQSKFVHKIEYWGQTPNGYFYSSCKFSTPEHCGTHIDAPIHFAKGRWTVDQIPLESLCGLAYIVDVTEKCIGNRDYEVGVGDIEEYEKKYGQIPEQSIIIFKTGYGKYYHSLDSSFGTKLRGFEAISYFRFPGISSKLAQWLTKNRRPKLVGIDTPSIDYGQSKFFDAHREFLGKNIPQLENIAHLDKISSSVIEFIALPTKIGQGTGAPVRIMGKEVF